MDNRSGQPGQQSDADAAPRVTRLSTGEYMVHKPVWTARVAELQARAEAGISTLIWTIFAAAAITSLLIALGAYLFFLYSDMLAGYQEYHSGFNGIAGALGMVALGFGLYKLIQFLVLRKADADYARVKCWLDETDLGLIIADTHRWEPIREEITGQPWLKGLCPPDERTFEAQLENAAVYCELLKQIAGGQGHQLQNFGCVALHYRSSTGLGLPCLGIACGCSVFSLWGFVVQIGSPTCGALMAPVIIAMARSYITYRARLMAICDFFLAVHEPEGAAAKASVPDEPPRL